MRAHRRILIMTALLHRALDWQVICVGNPARGDDGAGAYIAHALRSRGFDRPLWHTLQLQPDMASLLADRPLTWVIDASPTRTLTCRTLRHTGVPTPLFHWMNPDDLVHWSKALYPGWEGSVVEIAIPAHGFDPAASLSTLTRQHCEHAVRCLMQLSTASIRTVPDCYHTLEMLLCTNTAC